MFNFSKEDVTINKGDKIAQLIVERILETEAISIGENEELDKTERGDKGFGSTDKN